MMFLAGLVLAIIFSTLYAYSLRRSEIRRQEWQQESRAVLHGK